MRYYLPLLLFIASLLSCKDDDPIIHRVDPDFNGEGNTVNDIDMTIQLVDLFSAATLDQYYLWIDDPGRLDMVEAVFDPDTCRHPAAALSRVLSKEDRWTELIEKSTEREEYWKGTEESTGMDVIPYLLDQVSRRVFFVITYVHPGSPADKAGLKRGDIFDRMDGSYITDKNYQNFYNNSYSMKLGLAEFKNNGAFEELDKTVTIVPVKDYLEPVIMTKVFDVDGTKKVGYLHYTSFTDSVNSLISSMDYFKEQGASELIIDLRYNGGGYVSTCIALGSMMAPKAAVENGEVFNTDVFNKLLTEYYTKNRTINEYFEKKYAEHNPEFKKIYFLVSKHTASASESLIVGLNAYMDVTVIGEKTHGKFCTGKLMRPSHIFTKEFYNIYKEGFKDWGMYVMVGSFADKNGYNASRPDGYPPNTILKDDPFDGFDLGDPHETLLREALEQAGMKINNFDAPTRAIMPSQMYEAIPVEKPAYNIKKMDTKLEGIKTNL